MCVTFYVHMLCYFTLLGFTVVLVMMEPVVSLVKICFHLFGAVCFVFQFVMLYFLTQADECVSVFVCMYSITDMLVVRAGW